MRRLLLALVLAAPCAATPGALAQPSLVVASSPNPNATRVPRLVPVSVTFAAPLDAGPAPAVRAVGRWSGPVPGAASLSADRRTLTFTPARPYQAGEHVTVQVAGAGRSAAGEPLGGALGVTFWAAADGGTLDVVEVQRVDIRRPGEEPVVVYGAVAMDLDGDPFPDLVTSNEATSDVRVFRGSASGRYGPFEVVPLPGGAVPSPMETGDFDADGRADLAVANVGGDRVSVLLGDGAGGFERGASYLSGQTVRGLAVLDLDGDGTDDLVTGNRTARTVTILRGRPDGTFGPPEPVDLSAPVSPQSFAVADFDGDGRLDVAAGDFAAQGLVLLRADGAGGLAESARVGFVGSPWMIAAGDVDGDGRADVVAASAGAHIANVVYGDGAGGFEAVQELPAGQFAIAVDLGDLDGDGDLDLVQSHYASRDFYLWETLPGRAFAAPRTRLVAGAAACATLHDRDGDGDLDVTGIDELEDRLVLYDNPGLVAAEPAPGAAPALALAGPNPARGRTAVRVRPAAPGTFRVRLVDALGRTAAEVPGVWSGGAAAEVSLPLGGLAPGAYAVRLDAPGAALRLTVVR